MNSKNVLQKILTLLSDDKEVKFTEAQTKDGTILESPTFDLGEGVEVVGEDGKKTPAPDGEHEIALRDSEGKEVIIRIETKDGKITSRENVEEANPEVPVEAGEEVVDKKAAIEEHLADATTEEAHSLPNTTDEDIRNSLGEDTDESKDPIIRLGYRIDELEKTIAEMKQKFESAAPAEGEEVSSLTPSAVAEMESELPKLDGAPLESKFSADEVLKPNYGKKVGDSQSSFLSKLYK
jgi:hypothetical protein